MDQEQLAGLIEALVEVAVKFDVNLTFQCNESNDALRSAILTIDQKACGFIKGFRESQLVTIHSPRWNKMLRSNPGAYATMECIRAAGLLPIEGSVMEVPPVEVSADGFYSPTDSKFPT